MRPNAALLVALIASLLPGCMGIPSPVTNLHQTAALRARATCNATAEVAKFKTHSKPELSDVDRYAGAFSTPFKYLSSEFGGPGAWTDTGCNASGTGTPLRTAQHSTDDLYTIDVRIESAEVNGVPVPAGTYVRLEVRPGWPAHDSLRMRLPGKTDRITFRGPLIWDGDRRPPCFPDGHMEIHPIEPIEFRPTN